MPCQLFILPIKHREGSASLLSFANILLVCHTAAAQEWLRVAGMGSTASPGQYEPSTLELTALLKNCEVHETIPG